jgi:urease accessory protein
MMPLAMPRPHAAHLADADRRITSIDRRLTASKLAADERLGSERVGRRLAVEVSRLIPADRIVAFLAAVEAGNTPGNAAVAFGLAGEALGIDRRRTALAAASAQVMGLVAAAVRLGLIGHGAGQHCIAGAAPVIVTAVELASSRDWRDLRPSAPQLDIALARHERAPARSFVS